MHQRLIIAGLKLVGTDEESIGVVLDLVGYFSAREAVKRSFTDLGAVIIVHT